MMPGRKYEAQSGYRYGFNGKEKDKDMNSLTVYDYGLRIYNPGIGKFLSVDPLTKEYPWNSTYAFAENDVIRCVDLDGGERKLATMDQYEYNGSWGVFDFLKAVPNAAGKVYNGVVAGTWNSGVDLYNSANSGTLVKDLKAETTQMASNIKANVVASYKYHSTTPFGQQVRDFGSYITQPERLEDLLLFYGGTRFLPLGSGKGNLLKLETATTVKVGKYMSNSFKIGPKTLARVTKHLESLGFAEEAGNKIMLDRMQKIVKGEMKATEIDLNFARHELRESEFIKSGKNLTEAHHATLKEQNQYYPGSESKRYTQEAIDASNAEMNKQVSEN